MNKFLALTEEKRLTILNAAFQCFGKFGYEKASMSILLYYAYRRKLSKKLPMTKSKLYPRYERTCYEGFIEKRIDNRCCR